MEAPWSSKETLKTNDADERLSKEILDFEKYIAPTKEETLNRDTLLYTLTQLIDTLWPHNGVVTAFGSSVTGLAFPASDVDINIDFETMPKNNPVDVLKVIRKECIRQHIFTFRDTQLVAHAKVPVLMATDENQVSIDITVRNACFSSDRTAAWVKTHPALKPLFMILKQSLGNYRVSSHPAFEPLSAKTAGLASYSLVCLIVSYLQLQVPNHLSENDPTYYGELLIGFLSFYSKFENETTAISFDNGGAYLNKANCPIPLDSKTGKLTIVDPDVEDANVARSTLRFDTLKVIFKHALDSLLDRKASKRKGESILSSIIKVEHHYHVDPRRQGARFKTQHMFIENGAAKTKGFARNRFGGKVRGNNTPFDRTQPYPRRDYREAHSGDSYSRDRHSYSRERGNQGYQHDERRSNPYSRKRSNDGDPSDREYQRHKSRGNHHLAEHYRNKSERSPYSRR